ncbi:MAG: hypothetical protein ACREDL_18465 [Bradyrhizobium sp.]
MRLGYGVVQLDVTIVNTALGSIASSRRGAASPTDEFWHRQFVAWLSAQLRS